MNGVLIQYGCAFFLALICAMNSFVSVWPSYAIEVLESEESPVGYKISQNAANLIGSIPMLGSFIATLVAGYVTEAIGRKRAQLGCGLFYAVAWSLIVTARSSFQILLARLIMGLSIGISNVAALIYASEITHITVRGSAIAISSLMYNVGIMISYLQGWFCSYNVICYSNLTVTVLYVLLLSFLQESPVYLLKIGKDKEALKSLRFYRGESENTDAILEEFSTLKQQGSRQDTDIEPAGLSEKEKLQYKENQSNENGAENKNGWILLCTVPRYRRAIISSVTFGVLTSWMGMVAVQTYSSKFFTAAAPTLSPNLCSVIFSLILVMSNVLTVLVTDLLPRRTLMISTCFATTLCLATLGVAMHWPAVPSWVALAAVLFFCLVFHLGVINLVFVQFSEAYGPQVQSEAAVVLFCAVSLANFLVLFLFVPAVETIGIDGTFFVFTAISAFATVLSYFWTQETRRVPLQEIEKMYDNGIMYKKVANIES